ncbi:hypothetical protein SS50377_24657 [Spironucleus salmonicida]|uniref:Uncharacterized protein n=1 Tax=Spironucleus salmonicida TaxID=348837 RepID=V6LUI1_9EUKA|nr:hypothetical protein SS50377_24657 [Spironucleus salmonicida]|eukprot:EST44469.1 Hypothetical protein SS50377_15463 [Spironucleus salmonicida]
MFGSLAHHFASPFVKKFTFQDQYKPQIGKFTQKLDRILGKYIQPIEFQKFKHKNSYSYLAQLDKPDLAAIYTFSADSRPIEKFIKIRREVVDGKVDPSLIKWFQDASISGQFYGSQGNLGKLDLRKAFLQLVIEDIAEFQLHD